MAEEGRRERQERRSDIEAERKREGRGGRKYKKQESQADRQTDRERETDRQTEPETGRERLLCDGKKTEGDRQTDLWSVGRLTSKQHGSLYLTDGLAQTIDTSVTTPAQR